MFSLKIVSLFKDPSCLYYFQVEVFRFVSGCNLEITDWIALTLDNNNHQLKTKFYRDQAYDIPQKPIQNGQYMNNNDL